MKKLPILVILGLVTALIVLAVVLLNHNDLEQAGLREKKLVYFKIEEYRKEAVVQPVSDLLKEKDQTNQSTPRLAQKETTSRQEKEPVEEKVVPEEKAVPEEKEYTVQKEQNQKENQFWLYNAVDEDTLWDIAKKYYGQGKYYPVLLEHNPHAGIYDIGKGVTLNILKNGENAAEIYKKIIINKDGHFFWRYTVAKGDTLQSIIEKYYKKGQVKNDIPDLENGNELKPGEKIWVLIK